MPLLRQTLLVAGLLLLVNACGDATGPSGPPVRFAADSVVLYGDEQVDLDTLAGRDSTAAAGRWQWTASDSSIVRVDTGGRVRGARIGRTVLRAGLGGTRDSLVVRVVGFTQLSADRLHTCGRYSTGDVYCWGAGTAGQLGQGANTSASTPQRALLDVPATQVVAADFQSCALDESGQLWCWGYSPRYGEPQTNSPQPAPTTARFERLMAAGQGGSNYSQSFACAHGSASGLVCWTGSGLGPWQAQAELVSWDAHYARQCGLDAAGALHCTGTSPAGDTTSSTLFRVSSTPALREVSVGGELTCGLDAQARGWCWNRTQSGTVAVEVPGAFRWAAIEVQGDTACGVTTSGVLYCWGQLPEALYGATRWSDLPARAPLADVVGISLGAEHGCAVLRSGAATCWGSNQYGRLGDGNVDASTTMHAPVRVRRPAP